MAGFAGMRTLDVWYSRLDVQEVLDTATAAAKKSQRKLAARAEKNIAKARTKDSLQALSKLTEVVDGHHRIISDPPVVVPGRGLLATYGLTPDEIEDGAARASPRLPKHPA